MNGRAIQLLSVVVILVAGAWLVFEPGWEPVVTALVGLIGLLTTRAEVARRRDGEPGIHEPPTRDRPERRSVAVLPFRNLSEEADSDFFSDGITEELIASLSRIRDLKVISRTSVMAFKGTDLGAADVATRLGVAMLVEGSVRRAGDAVRITAALVDAETGHSVWSETYDRELRDLFSLQSEVAESIAGELNATVTREEIDRLHRQPHASLEAYDLYLLGWYHWNRWTDVGWRQGIEYFEKAIDAAPDFVEAHAALAEAYTPLAAFDVLGHSDAWGQAREHALQALKLDRESALANAALGMEEAFNQWDWPSAERSFRKAVTFDPGSAYVRESYGVALMSVVRLADAERELLAACELDPLHAVMRANVGQLRRAQGRFDEALGHMQEAVEMEPRSPIPRLGLGEVLLALGQVEDAVGEFEHSVDLARLPWGLMDLGHGYAVAGRLAEAQGLIGELEARPGGPASFEIAVVLSGLGETDAAFEWLDRACSERSYLLAQYGEIDHRLEELRREERFKALRQRMGRLTSAGS